MSEDSLHDMHGMARCAAEIMRTKRPLSPEFREQVAQMIEALSMCIRQLEFEREEYADRGEIFRSPGLDKALAVFGWMDGQGGGS